MCHNNNLRKVGGSMAGITVSCQASTHFDGRYRELLLIIIILFSSSSSNNFQRCRRDKPVNLLDFWIILINDTALARITATHIPKNTLFSCVNEAEIIH
ncbi:unnamed protein product [Rhizophagus irregularis]|nr:unnamed protein product [Rhizophagus irregularis]